MSSRLWPQQISLSRLRSTPRSKRAAAAATVALAIGLTACISIKLETTFQRAPGVVSLKFIVCASDYDASTYISCQASNVQETDNLRFDADGSSSTLGQLLVGFRVPDGSVGPESFLSDTQDATFLRSTTYTDALTTQYPPLAGQHWVGYISTPKTFDPTISSSRQTGGQPEFTLPSQANGDAFAGSYLWRLVTGFRQLKGGDASNPVDCGSATCFDSPPSAVVPTNLQAGVSDFGVLAGNSVTVGQSATATVTLPVHYVDAGSQGAQDLAITAKTTVPGATATPAVTNLRVNPNTTPTVDVSVAIPAGTPLASYTVTLSATTGSPAVTRSNAGTITVVDTIAPTIQISTPAQGATFQRGQDVKADYSCADQLNGTGVSSCAGTVAAGARIDTASAGTKTFTVNASDNAGKKATLSKTYTVVAPLTPRITATLAFLYNAKRTSTKFTRLLVQDVPSGSTVTAKCTPRKKPGRKVAPRCPVKKFTKKNASGKVSLKPFLRRAFTLGTVIEVTVTKPGSIGAVKRLTIRSKKPPSLATLCLPEGATKPTKC